MSVAEPILVAPGQGEVIGDSPERRVEILSDHETVHATLSRFAPAGDAELRYLKSIHTPGGGFGG
jgi:hypothetical protein